ncbi:MAG: hypothetical protein LBS64_02680 [Spirochaetaceae bacterium]|jgi:hypothetical protein|nr:hypothetical protein [Spirochaetaceae bacterium]
MMTTNNDQRVSENLRAVMGEQTFAALTVIAQSHMEDISGVEAAVRVIAGVFDDVERFVRVLGVETPARRECEKKLLTGFQNNLRLLIEKTWVEKFDEALKEQVLYRLNRFCVQVSASRYIESVADFMDIVKDTVYLMFGSQTEKSDFGEYAMRIDPDFGVFWQYNRAFAQAFGSADALPQPTEIPRILLLLGMFFIANY